jgi:CheY-like chemotaxis protein
MGDRMARQVRVLIVDDSAAALAAMKKALEGAGYAVKTAKSIDEAVPTIGGAEVVIVDFHMPGQDGGPGLARLKAAANDAGNARAKFYLHTSDPIEGANHGKYGFDGLLLYKGNLPRLVAQIEAIRPK